MRKIKNVVIRFVDGEYEMSHTLGGMYNCFRTFKNEQDARAYAKENGWRCTKHKYNGSIFINPPKD